MKIKQFISTDFKNNSYLLIRENKAVVIDFAGATKEIYEYLEKEQIKLVACLITHSHYDHYSDFDNFMETFKKVKFYLYNKQEDLFYNNNLSEWIAGKKFVPKSKLITVYNEKNFKIKGFKKLTFESFPGHTDGTVIFKYDNWIFTGDFIFAYGIGRMDFPTGNKELMEESLKRFCEATNENAFLYTGHGENWTFKEVKKKNYYLKKF